MEKLKKKWVIDYGWLSVDSYYLNLCFDSKITFGKLDFNVQSNFWEILLWNESLYYSKIFGLKRHFGKELESIAVFDLGLSYYP